MPVSNRQSCHLPLSLTVVLFSIDQHQELVVKIIRIQRFDGNGHSGIVFILLLDNTFEDCAGYTGFALSRNQVMDHFDEQNYMARSISFTFDGDWNLSGLTKAFLFTFTWWNSYREMLHYILSFFDNTPFSHPLYFTLCTRRGVL